MSEPRTGRRWRRAGGLADAAVAHHTAGRLVRRLRRRLSASADLLVSMWFARTLTPSTMRRGARMAVNVRRGPRRVGVDQKSSGAATVVHCRSSDLRFQPFADVMRHRRSGRGPTSQTLVHDRAFMAKPEPLPRQRRHERFHLRSRYRMAAIARFRGPGAVRGNGSGDAEAIAGYGTQDTRTHASRR